MSSFPSLFVDVNRIAQSQENLDSILKVQFKINEHQSYNGTYHLVGRAFRLHWTVKLNFTVCYKYLGR